MSNPEPSIRVNVDVRNPGQFFACCGLLELADRLWPGAEGWFSPDAREFNIACAGTLGELCNALDECRLTNTMTEEQYARMAELSEARKKEKSDAKAAKRKVQAETMCEDEYKNFEKLLREAPIVLERPFGLTLDWFTDDDAGGSRFKTWAGQQSVLSIASAMKDALRSEAWRTEDCLEFSASECGLPFNFDSNLGGQGGAVDVGFSFDPLAASALTRIESSARPALELLAFIGLQRFRPAEVAGANRFIYAAWTRPLPIAAAMPVACGAAPGRDDRGLEFSLLYRTKYLKSFLPAKPLEGGSDE